MCCLKQELQVDSSAIVDRDVKALLDSISKENFDSFSDQIITIVNGSEREKDAHTAYQVIKLVYEKATDERDCSEICARLCRKLWKAISPKIQDYRIKDQDGRLIAGDSLFTRYLLSRCQEDFERRWAQGIQTTGTAVVTGSRKGTVTPMPTTSSSMERTEAVVYSDESRAAQGGKQRGLGLTRFMGELFKVHILTERSVRYCFKILLAHTKNLEEERIESSCVLMTTVGQILDTERMRAHIDSYCWRMKELARSPKVNSRLVLMLEVCITSSPFVVIFDAYWRK